MLGQKFITIITFTCYLILDLFRTTENLFDEWSCA